MQWKYKALAENVPETPDDHPHTVIKVETRHTNRWFVLDDADSFGLHVTCRIDGEASHEELLPWSDVGQLISDGSMRIYGMTDEEVERLGE